MDIYLECLLTNVVSRTAVFLAVIGGTLMYQLNWYVIPIILFVIAGLLFFFTGFGMNSYLMCKRMMRILEDSHGLVMFETDTPCSKAAFQVALRRYNPPEEE